MFSFVSKCCPFTVDFTFWNKNKSQGARSGDEGGCGITVKNLDVKNCAQPRIPLLWDSWAPSGHKFFSSPIRQSVSNERFPGSCSLHQQSFWLLIFDHIEQVLYPCCVSPVRVADGHPLCCSSSTRVLPSENILCQRKGLCSWHCIISKGLLKYSTCCGGNVTEFNTKKA